MRTPQLSVKCWLVLAAVWMGSAAGFAATVEDVVERTFKVGSEARVEVTGFNGSISVNGDSGDEVRVRCIKFVRSLTGIGARRALDNIELRFDQDGDRVRIEARKPRGMSILRNSGVRFEIVVPRRSQLRARTSNGRINVQDLDGPMHLTTSNGSIRLDDVTGDIDVTTSNGRINADFQSDEVKVRTSNGGIYLEGEAGSVTARTSNGRIELELAGEGGSVNLTTSNGSITFRGPLTGKSEFRSSNAGVRLQLPAELAFEIDASTSNGRIYNEFEMSEIRVSKKKHLVARFGSRPWAQIRVRTSNSSIKIEED